MRLVTSLFLLNLLGCAAGATQRLNAARPDASHPAAVQDGRGATTNTGSGSGGPIVPTPHPNV